MDRLEAMAIFVVAVDSGSLAAAARQVGCSAASVTRAVAQLETSAGERLLDRTTRHFNLTEAGSRHLAAYRAMLQELRQLDRREDDMRMYGSIAITAPELYGSLYVMPVVEAFLKKYPRIRCRVILLNRIVDLVGEGVDVAVRIAALSDSSLHAQKVGETRRLICAAPSYLKTHPRLQHPRDLQAHSCIGQNESTPTELWQYRESSSGRRLRSVRVTCGLSVNSVSAAIKAAERGAGIVRPLAYQVRGQLADGSLVTVLEPYELEPLPVHMLFRPRAGVSVALRTFIDFAAPSLKRACEW